MERQSCLETRERDRRLRQLVSFSQWLMAVWVTPVNLGIYAAWIAFKSSAREGEIEDRIDLLESYCF